MGKGPPFPRLPILPQTFIRVRASARKARPEGRQPVPALSVRRHPACSPSACLFRAVLPQVAPDHPYKWNSRRGRRSFLPWPGLVMLECPRPLPCVAAHVPGVCRYRPAAMAWGIKLMLRLPASLVPYQLPAPCKSCRSRCRPVVSGAPAQLPFSNLFMRFR